MKSVDLSNISEFSENILLIRLNQESPYSNNSSFFLALSAFLREEPHWIEVVAAEESIAVKYDDIKISTSKAKDLILLHVPVHYSDEFGLDIEKITKTQSVTYEELINLHSNIKYEVKMIGFNPGFAYLGDLHEKLRIPRLSKPRINLLPGSVGIAGNRTGIYPFSGPGGWSIIGRTPMKLFDNNNKNPFVINPGMRVKFDPINKKEFESFNY